MPTPLQLVREHEEINHCCTYTRLSATVQQLKERSPAEKVQKVLYKVLLETNTKQQQKKENKKNPVCVPHVAETSNTAQALP